MVVCESLVSERCCKRLVVCSSMKGERRVLDEKVCGPVRDLNPGPLAPKARIIPLDQRAKIFKGEHLVYNWLLDSVQEKLQAAHYVECCSKVLRWLWQSLVQIQMDLHLHLHLNSMHWFDFMCHCTCIKMHTGSCVLPFEKALTFAFWVLHLLHAFPFAFERFVPVGHAFHWQ